MLDLSECHSECQALLRATCHNKINSACSDRQNVHDAPAPQSDWNLYMEVSRLGGGLPKSLKLYSWSRYKRGTYFSSAKPAVFRTTCRRNTRISLRTRTLWSVRWTAGEAEEKKVSAVDGVSYVWGENEVTVNPLSVAACLNVSIFHRRHFGLNFSSLIKIWERL